MKTFKYILFLLLILIIGFFIYISVQPNNYDVKRTKLINASANIIYNNINDLKQWENWGPWHDEDTTIVSSYSEKTIGIGAKSSWTSKDGPGNMTLISTIPNKSIDLKMQFYDYNPTDIYWILEEADKGTNVTWGMKNNETPFMFKIFAAMSGGMDKMLGEMEENGLNNLAKIAEEQNKNTPKTYYKLSDITEITLPAHTFIGYRQHTSTALPQEEMTKLFMEFMPKAGAYAASKLTHEDYTPGTYYTKWNEETKEAEFYIGLLLKKELNPAAGMTSFEIPEGKSIKISKFGNYGSGDYQAHMAIAKHLEDNKLEMNGESVWELYVNDPTTVNPKEIQTDIYYPIK